MAGVDCVLGDVSFLLVLLVLGNQRPLSSCFRAVILTCLCLCVCVCVYTCSASPPAWSPAPLRFFFLSVPPVRGISGGGERGGVMGRKV